MSTSSPLKQTNQSLEKITLEEVISRGVRNLLNHQHETGYWWYTLEANDSINAEYIMLLHYLGIEDKPTSQAICRWMASQQNEDGSWSLFHEGPGDISSTIECYMAFKMEGYDINSLVMKKARDFILKNGGITKMRVFSRIHLALFGLVDWKYCPNMPVALMSVPEWAPVNIYEFSSWARACIVPLLVIMDKQETHPIPGFHLNELYLDGDPSKAKWIYDNEKGAVSLENAFIQMDRALKVADRLKLKPLRKASLKSCEAYIRGHLSETEDIFPAMFYGILALVALGFPLTDQSIEKALLGLRSFQMILKKDHLHQVPFEDDSTIDCNVITKVPEIAESHMVYQQCCISPVWDTAWAAVALQESGVSSSDERLTKTAYWLLEKQITDVVGDWSIKNPNGKPGGWSFEFKNKHYPDLDDTIEVLTFLHESDLPYKTLKDPIEKGLNWLLSMQCKNGGFAAFDKDNNLELLNKIPFSDHGACLDPATVDITGRVISFLIQVMGSDRQHPQIQKARRFILERQEKDGSFWGRWGVNYLYGTWCALEALGSLGFKEDELVIKRAVQWLNSIQNKDGGFGECCDGYHQNSYKPLKNNQSTPSQTSWALMGYVGAGEQNSEPALKALDYLMQNQNRQGSWDEVHFTGTGFPGHFYIRYHGYRNYFPQLALAKYQKQKALTN